MTWEIVTGLIVLVGCAISVGTIVYKLANILTKLEAAIESLRQTIELIKTNNAEEHHEIFEMLKAFEKRLSTIETKFLLVTGKADPPVVQ